jgi:hypothetical protein
MASQKKKKGTFFVNFSASFEEKMIKTLKMRLSYEIPFVSTWSQVSFRINKAMNLGAQPSNILSTSKRIYNMGDSMILAHSDNLQDRESRILRLNLMKIFIISGRIHFKIRTTSFG